MEHMRANGAAVAELVENLLAYYEKCGVFTHPRPNTVVARTRLVAYAIRWLPQVLKLSVISSY